MNIIFTSNKNKLTKIALVSLFLVILFSIAFSFSKNHFTTTDTVSVDCATFSKDQQTQCFVDGIVAKARTTSITDAVSEVTELLQVYPDLQNECHAIMHKIGEESYQLYIDGVPLDADESITMCTYGFYHGFIDTVVQKEGSFDRAKEFCVDINRALEEKGINANAECYHGFGHAIVDDHVSTQFSDAKAVTNRAITICRDLSSTDDQYINCASGVYNAVANIFLTKSFAWPEINDTNSFAVCALQPEILQKTCYAFFARVALQLFNADIALAIGSLQLTVSPERRNGIIENMTNMFITNTTNKTDLQSILQVCHNLSTEESRYCISGLAVGILQSAPQGDEFELAKNLCENGSLTEYERSSCFTRLLYSSSLLFSEEKMKLYCDAVPKQYESDVCPT